MCDVLAIAVDLHDLRTGFALGAIVLAALCQLDSTEFCTCNVAYQ